MKSTNAFKKSGLPGRKATNVFADVSESSQLNEMVQSSVNVLRPLGFMSAVAGISQDKSYRSQLVPTFSR